MFIYLGDELQCDSFQPKAELSLLGAVEEMSFLNTGGPVLLLVLAFLLHCCYSKYSDASAGVFVLMILCLVPMIIIVMYAQIKLHASLNLMKSIF